MSDMDIFHWTPEPDFVGVKLLREAMQVESVCVSRWKAGDDKRKESLLGQQAIS